MQYGTQSGMDGGMQGGFVGYVGGKAFMQPHRTPVSFPAMFFSFVAPWLTCTVVAGVLSFSVHYDTPTICHALVSLCFCFVLVLGYVAFTTWRRKVSTGAGDARWSIYVFATGLVGFFVGYSMGANNYTHNLRPYYDVINLNMYTNVNPQQYRGQQLMDMGQVVFTPDTRLDLSRSMGFRNLDVYCVAPIVAGNGSMDQYDFWAVGTNCCSGHLVDFACGEYNNPLAHSGLRLMRDDLRPYFRLAVQQAEAAYNIKTVHPIFLYFMEDPMAEINAYQDDGFKNYLFGITMFFAIQLLLTVFVAIAFSKTG